MNRIDVSLRSGNPAFDFTPPDFGPPRGVFPTLRPRLAACKRGAFLYNFGRGTTVDESALIEALDSGALAGAALDVTQAEPLPEDSPLWGRGDVVITPHSSCVFEEYRALHVAELAELLRGYA